MPHGFGIGFGRLIGQAHEEGQRRKADDDAGEDEEGVLVAKHGGLPEHLLVCAAHGHLRGGGGRHAVTDEHFFHAIHVELVWDTAGNGVRGEVGLMDLRTAGEIRGEERGAGAASEISGEVGEAGDLVGLAERHAYVVEGTDRDEDEGKADDLKHTPECDGAEAGVEVEACEVVDACGGGDVAEADHDARVEFSQASTGHHHHDHHDKPCRREDHAGSFGGITEEDLKVLRDKDGRPEEHHAEDELEEDGGSEVSVFQKPEVDDGVFMIPLPDGEGDEGDDCEDGAEANRGVTEPILLLALVEGELKEADAEGDESKAHEVDLGVFGLLAAQLEMWRVFDHTVGEIKREQADGDVDEEDPVPVEVVGDPAAEGWANGWSDDDGHSIDSECLTALFDGEGISEDGLLAGGKAAASSTLQNAGNDEEWECIRDAA